ncbi:MAG: LacI family DNA-binding transcriptional regulator [Acidimicrobiia bacterium]
MASPEGRRRAPRADRGDRATIEDVAALAGVSVATVSRTLRGLANVAEPTRVRVQSAAESLNFRPDPHASRLAAGRSRTIGVAVPSFGPWYFSQVVAGVESVMAAHGYDVLLFSVGSGADRGRVVRDWPLLSRRVDGLILVDLQLEPTEAEFLAAVHAQVVTVGEDHPGLGAVVIDNEAAARLATQHLLNLGHRRIGLLGDSSGGPLQFSVPRLRRSGFHAAMRDAGIELRPDLEVDAGFTVAGGREATAGLLARPEPPTAIFAMSDEMAFGALRAVRDQGLRVPQDVSVVGIDDHELSDVLALTTVRQPVADAGALAAQALLGAFDGTELEQLVLPTALMVRGSTGPAPQTKSTSGSVSS